MKKEKNKEPSNIDPNKIYSLTEIVREGFIPGIKSYPAVKNRIMDDEAKPASKRVINAIKVGEGRGRKYLIKGNNLLAYIDAQAK